MSSNQVRVLADRDRCVGAGQCVLAAPEIFDQSDQDGKVLILPSATPADSADSPSSAGSAPTDATSATDPTSSVAVVSVATPPDRAPLRLKGLLPVNASPTSAGPLAAALSPYPQGPLVDEDVARAAVDLCPSRALSLARP